MDDLDEYEGEFVHAALERILRRPKWHRHAACRDAPEDVTWFAKLGESTAPAKAACAGCLVAAECRHGPSARDRSWPASGAA